MSVKGTIKSVQAPSAVLIIRPGNFYSNPETCEDNAFQLSTSMENPDAISKLAYSEVTAVAGLLTEHGVRTHVFEDVGKDTPDSVFPNNWISTHPGGHVAIYPMAAANRRLERRTDVVEYLKREYRVQDIIDYSGLEHDGLSLEGTGAMVLDHIDRVAYAVKSQRTDPIVLERFCTHFNYEPMVFDACDRHGIPIYHTNVMMCVATNFAMIGLDTISDKKRRNEVKDRLEETGRLVISLDNSQIENFAGNAVELQGSTTRLLAISERAYQCLNNEQLEIINNSCEIVSLSIPTIEQAGGSVRCMLAGIHLARR